MNFLIRRIRTIVLTSSFIIAIAVFLYIRSIFPEGTLQTIKLTQAYAFLAVIYLYISILASPLYIVFPTFPFRGLYIKARRAIGVSAFLFALLHAYNAFFGQLQGFAGLQFLSFSYLFPIFLGATSLLILFLMTLSSTNYAVVKLGKYWKRLHRFVYVVGLLTVIHALLLGTHFANLSTLIPEIFFIMLAILLLLEAIRIDRYLRQKFISMPQFGISLLIVIGLIVFGFLSIFFPNKGAISFDIHSFHIQLAKEAQNGNATIGFDKKLLAIPGFNGDRTKRYTVSFYHPDTVEPNTTVPLHFVVYDASNGNQMQLFSKLYEKTMHLIIVNDKLDYFSHIHPVQSEKDFAIETLFPKLGVYHLYVDFWPLGAIEQQMAFTLPVGTVTDTNNSDIKPDVNLTKQFENYEVTLSYSKPLKANLLSVGGQRLSFRIKDAKTKQPITTLKPYLAAFGHLVMINTKTFDYLHVHPTNLVAPQPNANGGPVVEFLPLGLYGPIKPGIYRVFAQFNPDNKLFVADFTVNVE